jgi:hypothetical protein
MTSFPQILIPVDLHKVMRQLPTVTEFPELPPEPPEAEPQPTSLVKSAIAIIIFMSVIGIIGSRIDPRLLIVLLLAGLIVILLQTIIQLRTYKTRLRNYAAAKESYFELLEVYSRQESKYQQEIAITRTSDRLIQFRLPSILQILKRTDTNIAQISDLIEPEHFESLLGFSTALEKAFPNQIYEGVILNIPGFDYLFTPNFTYINKQVNLYIAILIDTAMDRQEQEICDRFLLKSGWLIVRFTEPQVTSDPDRCCRVITKLVDDVLGGFIA